jgi:hypothetical protein
MDPDRWKCQMTQVEGGVDIDPTGCRRDFVIDM